jgi:outer membrane protein assembly factor BamB
MVALAALAAVSVSAGPAMAKKPAAPVNTALPAISGSPVEGTALNASPGSWSGTVTSFSYQWQRCSAATCANIGGATTNSYTPGPPDWGNTLRVAVTAANSVGRTTATSAPTATVTAPAGTSDTAYQLNSAHTGVTPDGFWTGAVKRWTTNLGASISYPLIVGHQVFAVAADGSSTNPRLYALNADTGAVQWGPIQLGGTYPWAGLTFDSGRVFTVNSSGTMEAFDAATGTLIWTTQLPGQYSFSSPPTATGGLVFTGGAGSGGTLYAVNESDGSLAWSQPVENGDNSSPAVSSTGVYVSYACGQAYDFTPASGTQVWHDNTSCEGGGGKTPVLANGSLYVRDSTFPGVLDASTGAQLSSFASSGPAPAVTSSNLFDLQGGTLSSSGSAPGAPANWTFAGDGTLSSAPVVAGGLVFEAGTSGNVYGLSVSTGQVVWSANAGAPVAAPDEQNVSQPLTGLAASGGLLVVPAGSTLVAFR